jgi:hypothetical protein
MEAIEADDFIEGSIRAEMVDMNEVFDAIEEIRL